MAAGAKCSEQSGSVAGKFTLAKARGAHAVFRSEAGRKVLAAQRAHIHGEQVHFTVRETERWHLRAHDDGNRRAEVLRHPVLDCVPASEMRKVDLAGIFFAFAGEVHSFIATHAAHFVASQAAGGVEYRLG